MAPGGGAEPRAHGEDQMFLVIDGALTVGDGGREIVARSGEAVRIPRGSRACDPQRRRGARRYLVLTYPTDESERWKLRSLRRIGSSGDGNALQ